MDRLEVIFEDHGKELKELSKISSALEKKDGGADGSSAIKAYINYLKMEVASLKSTDISSLRDSLDLPSGIDINVAPKGITGVDVPSEGNEEVNVPDSPETNKDALEVESHSSELDELRWLRGRDYCQCD